MTPFPPYLWFSFRENNLELRELESKLRIAYVNRARAAQLAEKRLKEAADLRDLQQEAEENDKTLAQLRKEDEEQERREILVKLDYRRQLTDQLACQQEEKDRAYAEFLEEKRRVDEIVAKVKKEIREKRLETLAEKEFRRRATEEFLRIQEELARKEREKIAREDAKILEYVAIKEKRDNEWEERKKRLRESKSEVVAKLAEEIRAQEQEELEREALMLELYQGRRREEERRKDLEEMEIEIRRRLMLKESREAALEYKRRQKMKELAEEEAWRKEMMDQKAEEDRLEQMNDQKRRMRQLQHRKEIEVLLEEKRRQRHVARQEEEEFWAEQKREEEAMAQVVKEERRKLLQKHASKLVGFLPKGIIEEDDLEVLDDEVRKSFQKRPFRDPLAELEAYYETK